jgi:hypothetical protein
VRRPERGLAHAGRADEAEDRAACVGLELAHREELEDAVLDLLDVVVVLVEHRAGVRKVEVVLGGLVPGQRRHPLQVGADDPVLGGLRREVLQALELAVDLAADLLGQLDGVELLAQLVGLGRRLVELAELLADRLELLAQDELALALVDLRLDLALDLRADRDDLELACEDVDEAPQPLADVDLLEQALLLLGLDAQRAGDEMAQRAGVVDVGDRQLQLLGQVRVALDDRGEGLAHVAHERLELGALRRRDIGLLGDLGHEIGGLAQPAVDVHALAALDEHAHGPVGHLDHAGDRADHADLVELRRPGRLDLRVARSDHHQHPVAAQHVVDEADRALLADRQRRQGVGQRDRLAQRQDRQRAGHRALGADLDRAPVAAGPGDLDHERSSPSSTSSVSTSIATLRARGSGRSSGSSMRSIPSR